MFVNGVRFKTDEIGDKVQSNDGITSADPSAESSVQKGMILQVTGSWDKDAFEPTGTAKTISYDDTFRGPLTAAPVKDTTGRITQIELLGQRIKITRRTVFDGIDNAAITEKTNVRVSAWYDGNEYRASYVGLVDSNYSDPQQYVEVEGAVSDVTKGGFKIGSQVFTYPTQVNSGVVYSDDLTEAFIQSLEKGDRLEVEGEFETQTGMVRVREVGKADDSTNTLSAGEDLELSGPLVQTGSAETVFMLNGVRLEFTAATEFDGLTRDQLTNGLLVEVEGTVNVSGDRLQVEDIERLEFDAMAGGEVEGRFKRFNESDNTLVMVAENTGLEVTVLVTARTLVDFDDAPFKTLSDLNSSQQIIELEVEGIPRENGDIEALYIEVEIDD